MEKDQRTHAIIGAAKESSMLTIKAYTFLKKQTLRKPYFEKNYEAGASLTTAFPSWSLGTSCGTAISVLKRN